MKGHGDVFGLEVSHNEALDADPGITVKASQGLLYGWHIKNATPAALYVQFFDAAGVGDVNLGTTTPKLSIGIEANGKAEASYPLPMTFGLGICIFSTTTVGGSTDAASDVDVFFA
jgi:hypothetical protein